MSDVNNSASSEPVVSSSESQVEASSVENLEASEGDLESSEEVSQESEVVKEAEKQLKKLFKLKVDGEEIEEELDLSDEATLQKKLQLAHAAQKRMEEAAKTRKQYEQLDQDIKAFLQVLKQNPREILNDPSLGIDIKALAEEIINEEIEESQKTPEQKEKERLQKELEEYKKKLEETEKAKEQERLEKLQNEVSSQIEKDIIEAIEHQGLPKTDVAIQRVAQMLHVANQYGIDISVKDVAPIVKQQLEEEATRYVQSLSDEQFEKLIGKEKIESVRKKYLKNMKQVPPTAKSIKRNDGDVKGKQNKENKKETYKDFFSRLGSF